MPNRIRRMRVKGWRRGDAVIVDRTSRYGNPWKVGDPGVPDRAAAVTEFALALAARRIVLATVAEPAKALEVLRLGKYPSDKEIQRDLRGKDLACPCPLPEPGEEDHCHAAWLIHEANQEVPSV